MSMLQLTGESLTIEDVIAVARHGLQVAPLSETVIARMNQSYQWIYDSVYNTDRIIYGVNTGFGPLARTRIAPEQARQLSRNIILNCCAGVGEPHPVELVRAAMLIRVNIFAKGHSGIRPLVAQTLIDMLNRGVTPVVPSKGSLGASGDLAPLAHIAVVLTRGEHGDADYSGEAWFHDERLSGAEAMRRASISRIVPEAKEGLSLTNGTTFMVASCAIAVHDAQNLIRHAEIAAALSIEALLGLSESFHPALHQANGQPGQITTAANILSLVEGSKLIDSIPNRVQDAYSVRCTPQVIGPARDAVEFVRERVTIALNAASDNPLIFTEDQNTDISTKNNQRSSAQSANSAFKVSGGNFHGQGPSMWLNFLSIAMSAVANISERRTFRLTTPELSEGLPSMLVKTSGLDSGLMIPQYTAAALVSDNKTLSHPDSVDSIPSSANQEDHVSMGANSARHTLEILDNVRYVIAIEMLTATQAIDLRENGAERLGKGTRIAYSVLRKRVKFLEHDKETTSDIETICELIRSEKLLS
ncbi:MAG: histidine ammonia-lyase [Chloroflexi bacterium]|nr:histidine ammonia-lyase [Chloroflexota bacterium]